MEDGVVLLEDCVVLLNLDGWLVIGFLDVALDDIFLIGPEPMIPCDSVSDDSVESLVFNITDDVDKIEPRKEGVWETDVP